ncbi:uncharacterized protein F5Z01DRAFT_671868 [Emericellopsis atlantica]|uniref:Uncharacterized protein n=1 Tax=Emericellopsis atlantica TaxID=2614577 RepID=A0A9P7ZQT0_9HYPO|nr:uncharacterized protein F5Z01DRAFT_671868 [Emericellopsis atlantica]KAG9256614.1 hypothetical protein F5Z01DRAFT_671868 [Emericellopsis atlantica]
MRPRPVLLSTLTLVCAVSPTAHAFQFTGPDSVDKLDLANPITVSWRATGGSLNEPEARSLELWFRALIGDSGDQAGWQLAANLSISSPTSYEWDPSSIVEGIQDNDLTLSPEAVHTFEARLLDGHGTKLATVQSDKYAVEGFDFIESSDGGEGTRDAVYMALVGAAAGVVLGVL